ncbi:hypothetical protein [Thermoactinospora rubra]|uniref:hypothetical protein n=1 Tax=Thermoactinospora rubra TaxID=1088767 RepID=UPI00197E0EE9|nr:hypothetical protein [Thermoactinospora rubra]
MAGGQVRHPREPSLGDAIWPLVALVVLIGGSLALFGLDALDGPIQIALVLCAMIAGLVVLKNGHRWEDLQASGQRALSSITTALFILPAVGALIGTWNMPGTIPTLVYYGIQVLSPGWYYAATALICAVIAMSIGSSWTTVELRSLGDIFWITPLNLLPLLLLVVLSARKVPATLALIASALFAGLVGMFTQPAVTFGTILEEFGLINRLIEPMVRGQGDGTAVPDRVRQRVSASTSSPATSTSRWCCPPGSSAPSSPDAGWRRRTCPG